MRRDPGGQARRRNPAALERSDSPRLVATRPFPDAQRCRADAYLDEEHEKRADQRQQRGDEDAGDRRADIPADEGVREQHDDDHCGEQGRERRQRDGAIDESGAPGKHDELVALRFEHPKTAAPLGVVVQWNCHPEVLDSTNTAVTADFVGYTVGHLRKSQKCPVVYFTGTVGGLMTTLRLPVKSEAGVELKDGTFEKADRYGTLVGRVADAALAKAVPLTLTPFDVRTRAVLVPMDNPVYRLGYQLGTLKRPIYEWAGDPTPKAMAATASLEKPVAAKTEVGYLRFGELEVAAIPGEIYPELVLGKVVTPAEKGADFPDAPAEPAVYEQMRGKHKMLIGLANDELGYFVPKRQWDEKEPFCYGRKSAQYGELNSVGPETAPILCETFRRLAQGK